MRITLLLPIIFLSAQFSIGYTQVTGTWEAVDDNDGKVSSHIEIALKEDKISGVVTEIYKRDRDAVCIYCDGNRKDQPVLGMEIIWDMKKDGDTWKGGKILDPENGKTYKCKIKISEDNPDVLEVRGFIGISLIGRTQYWRRKK